MSTDWLMDSIEELKIFFKNLPDEMEREYEIKLTRLVTSNQKQQFEEWLKQLIESEEDSIAYASFVCLNIKFRRSHDYSKLDLLINGERSRFNHHVSFSHMELLSLIDNSKRIPTLDELQQGKEDISKMPRNAGVLHLFADLVATYFENRDTHSEGENDVEPHYGVIDRVEWLDKAMSSVERAIQHQNYAKFYCTRGRILALRGYYQEAMRSIKDAIDLEDSSVSDYAIRVGNYQYHKLSILARMQNKELRSSLEQYKKGMDDANEKIQKNLEETTKKLESSTIKNLEFLGLFAGIISFTVGGISIASSMADRSFTGAAALILILMGALLCVFASFGVVLHGIEKGKIARNAIVFVGGGIIVFGGLWLCLHL